MTYINTAKSLVKRKISVSELEVDLSKQEREEIELLVVASQKCLKNIKFKIKEKSKITQKFKNQLSEQERAGLKIQVAEISGEIKHTESELKEREFRLCEILSASKAQQLPIQFTVSKTEQFRTAPLTFAVLQLQDEWEVQWSQFLSEIEQHSAYHRPQWLQVLSDYSGFEVFLFVLKLDDKIVAGVPMLFMKSFLFGKSMVSVPYVNYGGMVSYSSELTTKLFAHMKNWATEQNIDYFEFRTTSPELNLPVKSEKSSMVLRLPSTNAQLEEQLTAKVRAQYKKANAYKPQVVFGGLELLNDFYKVFARNMRDLGTPVYSKALFMKILQNEDISSFLCVVKINNEPVSVAFLTGYRDMLEIPWASTVKSANKYDANMWMYRMILQKAIDLGYEYFDFGRSTIDASTYKFKKQWRAQPIAHHWYYLLKSGELPQTNPNNPKYRFLIAVWKRLPVWLANIIGPHIVKSIP
ncbi:FemAB family PEP-CTERM system-associated protein [Glaciecola sp. XM2]|uniref:FemAB family XrtA/PEP-CTERM system-associated protein n=1 Tax=Glaciecola sp. XM2 TaxID=1914931 RepID=UPI001BDE0E44|nr:FemAB family XrtA/PEP-CTERM system-associated protein [Glaciecola sp. XM2]MBT1450645.1 FemAB family PEP-CTERM system-associated protein [Glaciecola sp. XM2]